MAFDAERAARRLTDAGMEERAANGVADVVGTATTGLATEANLQARFLELKADLATAKAEWKAELEKAKFQLFAGIFGATGIVLAAMRLWM